MFIDSHCHLNLPRDNPPVVADILAANQQAKVDVIQTICTRPDEFAELLAIAKAHPNIYCSFGIHPHEAENFTTDIDEICEKTQHPKVIGIGETGLDYYYENAPKRAQWHNFMTHLQAAKKTGLPVIIHTREAEADTKAILAEALADVRAGEQLKLLFHCFTSSRDLAEWGLERGVYLSASGIITFKKTQDLRDTFAVVPLDKLLIETDSPYLAPEPHRGQQNQPALVAHVAAKLAEMHDVPVEEIGRRTTDNFFTLFHKAQRVEVNNG